MIQDAIQLAMKVVEGAEDAKDFAVKFLDTITSQSREYIARHGVCCPKCGRQEIQSDQISPGGDTATANVHCEACNFEGVEIWELVGVEDAEENVIED